MKTAEELYEKLAVLIYLKKKLNEVEIDVPRMHCGKLKRWPFGLMQIPRSQKVIRTEEDIKLLWGIEYIKGRISRCPCYNHSEVLIPVYQ